MDAKLRYKAKKVRIVFFDIDDTLRAKETGLIPESVKDVFHQLKEKGIHKITIVVGFMKEQYEYLIDEYGVELVYNKEYAVKNNLFSLAKVYERLANAASVP